MTFRVNLDKLAALEAPDHLDLRALADSLDLLDLQEALVDLEPGDNLDQPDLQDRPEKQDHKVGDAPVFLKAVKNSFAVFRTAK